MLMGDRHKKGSIKSPVLSMKLLAALRSSLPTKEWRQPGNRLTIGLKGPHPPQTDVSRRFAGTKPDESENAFTRLDAFADIRIP